MMDDLVPPRPRDAMLILAIWTFWPAFRDVVKGFMIGLLG